MLYGKRVISIKHEIFTPLVMSTIGGMGSKIKIYFARLSQKISKICWQPYPVVASWSY